MEPVIYGVDVGFIAEGKFGWAQIDASAGPSCDSVRHKGFR
jgi:hypothetical protein